MTCKDCYHYDVCSKKDGTTDYYGKIGACNYVDEMCKCFKDKSLIVELPCKVGEELFLTDYIMCHHRLKEYKFIGNRVVMVIECFELQSTCKRFVDEHFGVTVFADKSKAEAKLKELNNG
nr:MAG TPA: hypothetical protein [Caudoviricetes sp.]